MNQNETVDQHYVSKFYLKKFALVKGKGKKEKAFTSFYQFEGGFYKEHIPTKSICYKRYFYGEDGAVEKEFARKELLWANTFNTLIADDDINLEESIIDIIKEFTVYQYCRTLAMYNHTQDMMSQMIAEFLHPQAPSLSKSKIQNMARDKMLSETNGAYLTSSCDELIREISDLDMCIIRYNTERKLITSDMPVVLLNPFCKRKAGFANVGVVIFFPISPEVLIVLYDGKIYENKLGSIVSSNEEEVLNLNKYQVMSSEERIIYKDINELSLNLLDEELNSKRLESQKKSKIESSYDGKGVLFATKSRRIRYDYELSFCRIPRCLRKIPSDCREAFSRKFKPEARLNLLIRVYRLPDLISENKELSHVDVRKMRDGYSKMQRFMDEYWEVPIDERTITPELMRKLKTVPVSYFPIIKS